MFEKDCLVYLGTCIAPVDHRPGRAGKPLVDIELRRAPDDVVRVRLVHGALQLIELADGAYADAVLRPARGVDVGAGPGVVVERKLRGGVVGVVLDGRGRRPFVVPGDRATAKRWSDAMQLYPDA